MTIRTGKSNQMFDFQWMIGKGFTVSDLFWFSFSRLIKLIITVMEEREYLELREWTPLTDLWQHIPATLSKSLILTQEVHVTCLSAADEFIAIGSNCGLIFWYNRAKRTVVRLKCDVRRWWRIESVQSRLSNNILPSSRHPSWPAFTSCPRWSTW